MKVKKSEIQLLIAVIGVFRSWVILLISSLFSFSIRLFSSLTTKATEKSKKRIKIV